MSSDDGFGLNGEGALTDKRLLALARLANEKRPKGALSGEEAAVALRFVEQFIAPVREWCLADPRVARRLLAIHDGVPAVFVIPSLKGYDFSLAQPLADLDRALHQHGWSCHVLQLPSGGSMPGHGLFDDAKAIQLSLQAGSTTHAHSG